MRLFYQYTAFALVLTVSGEGAALAACENGAESCAAGYVWREAFPEDRVCVSAEERARAAEDNQIAARLVGDQGGCAPGSVPRLAKADDRAVCVLPHRRAQIMADNAAVAGRRDAACAEGAAATPAAATAPAVVPASARSVVGPDATPPAAPPGALKATLTGGPTGEQGLAVSLGGPDVHLKRSEGLSVVVAAADPESGVAEIGMKQAGKAECKLKNGSVQTGLIEGFSNIALRMERGGVPPQGEEPFLLDPYENNPRRGHCPCDALEETNRVEYAFSARNGAGLSADLGRLVLVYDAAPPSCP